MAWIRCCGGAKKEKIVLLSQDPTYCTASVTNNVLTATIPSIGGVSPGSYTMFMFEAKEPVTFTHNPANMRYPADIKLRVFNASNVKVIESNSVASFSLPAGTYTVRMVNTQSYSIGWNDNGVVIN